MNFEPTTSELLDATYFDTEQQQNWPDVHRFGLYAGRVVASVGMLAATACGANTVTVNQGGNECVSIQSDAAGVAYETTQTQEAAAKNVNLDGLVANTTVKVSDHAAGISYSITAPRQLLDESFKASARNNTFRMDFACPKTPLKMPKLPEVVITMPEHGAVDVTASSVGNTHIGDTNGTASVENNGTGDVTIGNVASAKLNLSGTGDIDVDEVRSTLSIDSSGTGNITVRSGSVDQLDIESSGTGDVRFAGSAREGKLIADGTGDVHVKHVDRITEQRADGTGSISVG